MLHSRAAAAAPDRPLVALLRAGLRVVQIDCAPPAGTDARPGLVARAVVGDALEGLKQFEAATAAATATAEEEEEAAAAQPQAASGSGAAAKAAPAAPVAVMGVGLGGFLALNAVGWSDRFAAAICQGGAVSERWRDYETGVTPGPARHSEATLAGAAAASEAELLARLGSSRTPTLLLYGDSDPRLPISHAHVAYHALSATSAPSQLVVYPSDTHELRVAAHRRDATRRVVAWLLQHLKAS